MFHKKHNHFKLSLSERDKYKFILGELANVLVQHRLLFQ